MVETNCIRRARRCTGFDVLRLCSSLSCKGKGHGHRVKLLTAWVSKNLEVRLVHLHQ